MRQSVSVQWKKQNEGQRSKGPRILRFKVPVAAEKAENWFERKSAELVESFVQGRTPQSKKAKEVETA